MPFSIAHPEPAPAIHHCRNIVICCDGTGNQFTTQTKHEKEHPGATRPENEHVDACNSNVVRLYTALCVDNDQIAYYHPGVGTMGAATARGKVEATLTKWAGLAFGRGFRENVLDAYRYLMETYNDGDHVFLFGFSRGAYTARALAGLLHGYGLLCRGNEGHIPYAWDAYVNQLKNIHDDNEAKEPNDRIRKVKQDTAFRDTFSHPTFAIHFVGVWDTVSSIGWISDPLELIHMAQNPSMIIGRHAVSIDERRCFFQDNLWGEALPHQDILQVWFSGVHSDVGGSYPNSESYLSNEALDWLLTEAEAAGLRLKPERRDLVLGRGTNPRYSLFPLYNPAPQPSAKAFSHDELKQHLGWRLLEYLPSKHFDAYTHRSQYRIPRGAHRQVPPDSLIHPSVLDRRKRFGYNPPNLDLDALTLITHPKAGENPKAVGMYRSPGNPNTANISSQSLAPAAATAAVALAALTLGGLTWWLRS